MGGAASTGGHKSKPAHSLATHNTSRIPLPKHSKKQMTAKDFDKIHQKNFDKSVNNYVTKCVDMLQCYYYRSQSIVDYHNRRQVQLSAVTPLGNSVCLSIC